MNITLSAQVHLSGYGIKPSVQRLAIMDYLIANRIHPTADDIYNALYTVIPTLSRTTVYNTLKLFAEQGAVQVLGIDDKNVRFDIDTTNHAHFKCLDCSCVYDVPVENIGAITLEGIGELQITETHLYYKGYCKKCRKKSGKKILSK